MYRTKEILIAILFTTELFAQKIKHVDIEVGKKLPLQSIKGISYYPERDFSLSKLNGKWLVLDFWTINCTSCIASFPKMSELRTNLKDKVEVIMVAAQDPENKVKQVYQKYKDKFNLNLPVFYDSLLFAKFQVRGCPYIIIVDDKGIVKAITSSIHESEMKAFFIGETPVLSPAWNREQEESMQTFFDFHKPLLLNGNGGHDTDFLFRCVLAKWNSDVGSAFNDYISYKNFNQLQGTGVNLLSLYKLAYGDTVVTYSPTDFGKEGSDSYGKWWLTPLLEIGDSAEFSYDYLTGKNIFNYSVIVPKSKGNAAYLKQVLQSQLFTFFHYDVNLQKRKMPYWRLTLIGDSSLLMTRKVEPSYKGNPLGVHVENLPLNAILTAVWDYNQLSIFEDETGIHGNVDLSLDCIMTDFEEIKAALERKGLRLVKGEKEMNVIVISNPVNKS